MAHTGWRVVIFSNIDVAANMVSNALRQQGHEPITVIAARRKNVTPGLSSIDADTVIPDTPIFIAENQKAAEQTLASLRPDLLLSWAYPWRLSGEALDLPRLGAINYHPSLLPRHRGPNPVAWTIRMDDHDYGGTWHRMLSTYDSGPLLAQRSTPALDDDEPFSVFLRLTTLGQRMLRGVLERVGDGDPGDPQALEGATEAGPFGDDYATIDWSLPARDVHRQIRAWSFTGGVHSVVGPVGEIDGKLVRVVRSSLLPPDSPAREIECRDAPIWILETEALD